METAGAGHGSWPASSGDGTGCVAATVRIGSGRQAWVIGPGAPASKHRPLFPKPRASYRSTVNRSSRGEESSSKHGESSASMADARRFHDNDGKVTESSARTRRGGRSAASRRRRCMSRQREQPRSPDRHRSAPIRYFAVRSGSPSPDRPLMSAYRQALLRASAGTRARRVATAFMRGAARSRTTVSRCVADACTAAARGTGTPASWQYSSI